MNLFLCMVWKVSSTLFLWPCCCLVTKSCLILATPWTVARQALCSWDFPGKNTRVGGHFFLQGIFPSQGLNPHLLHWWANSLPVSHWGSPLWHVAIQFPQQYVLKRLFPVVCSCLLCHRLTAHINMGPFLGSLFYSIGLCVFETLLEI